LPSEPHLASHHTPNRCDRFHLFEPGSVVDSGVLLSEMLGELMTFPVRAGLRVTEFALRTTLTASARALALASGALKAMSGSGTDQSQETSASSTRPSSTRAASPSAPTTSTTGNGVDPRSEASAPPEVEPDPAGAAES